MVGKVVLARIISTHGVKGLLKVQVYNDYDKSFFLYKDCLSIENKIIQINKKFKKGNYFICEISKIKNKSDATLLLDKEIWIYESDLRKIDDKEYYHRDLIDCLVIDKTKNKLGKIKAIHNFGAGDILELDSHYQYMIRLEDINDNDIDIKKKIIVFNSDK